VSAPIAAHRFRNDAIIAAAHFMSLFQQAAEAAMQHSHLFVITGASRGMGAAIAAQLLQPGHTVLGISRRSDDRLGALATAAGATCEQWSAELAAPAEVAKRLQDWLGAFDAQRFESASLINNAAALTRVGHIDDCDDAELASALRVGLEAPLLLSAAFLRATRGWRARKRVLNISSGLGRRAIAGQATYCAVKAGLDHFSRALALDEARHENGAAVVSLAPGVIDTDMQVQLRGADAAGFPEKGFFVDLKEKGQLTSPEAAAARVLAYLNRGDFGSHVVADVREA
jgi:NAD(P)-dependent dehydrogenase (short-subunit alcohol dehydrogenase family)